MHVIPSKTHRSRSKPFILEELESRICPTAVCDANPTYQAECDYLNNLVPTSTVTVAAVQSGNWSNPATWGGKLPGKGDNVWIPNGITVTVDKQEPGQLRSILDNGVLTFATNVNTSLTVNTVVVGTDNNPSGLPEGELDIGTAAKPIQAGVTAKLIFADLGPQSQLFPKDWLQLSGGLISMGTLNIYGSQVTPWVDMHNAAAGDTTLTLSSQPIGWKVGDTLLLPGTSPTAIQDEQVQIAAIRNNADGTATVRLKSPLQYAHSAPAGQFVQVADENRSVVIQSQDVANHDGAAGQVMEMHNDAVSVQYAALLNLGRTNKAVPLNNAQLDTNGNLIPFTGSNQVGRYALHFHRDYYPGINSNDAPIQVVGNFEMGSPGWGYDNHSSNVDFIDNVAYDNFGASFADEAGNELGCWMNNLSINTPGVPNSFNSLANRSNVQDFGWNGAGFWLTSPSTEVEGNHVWEAQIGYAIYDVGLIQPGLGSTNTWNRQPPQNAPLAPFTGNTAGEVVEGINVQWRLPTGTTPDTIDHFAAWDVTDSGIALSFYTTNTNLVDDTLLGVSGARFGIVANPNGYSFNLNVIGAHVEGFQIGYSGLCSSMSTIQGGCWNDAIALSFPAFSLARQVIISGPITFGPNVVTRYALPSINLAQYVANLGNFIAVNYPNNIFEPDQIRLPDGRQLYAVNQAANYVPFPTGTNWNLPAQWVGLTNAQLWARYGVAPGAAVAPANATSGSSTDALIGSARLVPTTAWLVSSTFGLVGSPYQLQYSLHSSNGSQQPAQTYLTAVELQPGWNVVTRVINGTTYSWLVWGNVFNRSYLSGAAVGVPSTQTVSAPAGYRVSYVVTSGTIPPGLTFTTKGNTLTIGGTASAVSAVTFNLTATDAHGKSTTQRYALGSYPQNVSGQIQWTASALTYHASKRTYDGTIKLTNVGPTALSGTLLVVLTGLPSGVTVDNADGIYWGGYPYFLIKVPGHKLAAGQSMTFAVRFRNPNGVQINYGVTTYENSL